MLWWPTTGIVAPEMVAELMVLGSSAVAHSRSLRGAGAERRFRRLEQAGDAHAIRGGSTDGGSPRSLYRNYVIEIASVPVDGGWSFTVDIFGSDGITVKSIGAGKAVIFATPRHATQIATTMARAWIDGLA